MTPRLWRALIALCVLLWAAAAWGQRTGGRIGRSSWGSRPSTSYSRPSYRPSPAPSYRPTYRPSYNPPSRPSYGSPSYGSRPSYGSPTPSYGTPSYGTTAPSYGTPSYGTPSYGTTAPSYGSSYRPYPGSYSRRRMFGGVGLCPVLFLLVLLGGVALLVSRKRAQPFAPAYTPMPYGQPYAPMTPQVALRRVSVGLAAGRRREVQSELEALQARFPNDAYPLAMAARDLLLRTLGDAVYGYVELGERPESEAEGTFTRTADDLRGRYTVERIQNDLRLAELQMQAQREEGEGLVVVSLLVALRGAMAAPPITPDRHGVAAALQSLQCAPHDLLALEIVWSPAQDTDRMSSAELEVVYPELRRLDARAAYGRVTCGHCAAVYAAELGQCPACGAPRPA